MVEYLRLVMLAQTGGVRVVETMASPDTVDAVLMQAENYPRRALLDALNQFNKASSEAGAGWQPQLPLELALVESIDALYAAPAVVQYAAPAQQARQPQAAPAAQAEEANDTQDDDDSRLRAGPRPGWLMHRLRKSCDNAGKKSNATRANSILA